MKKIIGPFTQIVTMDDLPAKGPIKDEQLTVLKGAAVLVSEGRIVSVNDFKSLIASHPDASIQKIESDHVLLPGFIDCHTHICFGGSRARDYAARNNGKSYQEIAAAGGGIWDTVTRTRSSNESELEASTLHRLNTMLKRGITTIEIKSGYGLRLDDELKMLRVIKACGQKHKADIVATCLAAHIIPREFAGEKEYLNFILEELLPVIEREGLARRFDIFVEENAFSVAAAKEYLKALKSKKFDITVHGDQFTVGGSQAAIELEASSVDHLEASGEKEILALAKSETVPVVLPGASLGLGIPFAPARRLLDAGCGLAIASDWNPGSAPNGNLLTQASILGAYENLSSAEIFAGLTYRSAKALNCTDRGRLKEGMVADLIAFETEDYREILYQQGEMQPTMVWKKGEIINLE